MTNKEIFEMCERPFTPQVTMEQIVGCSDPIKFLGWNIDKRISVLRDDDDDCVGMIMKLNHKNFNDMLLITLSWDDTYRVRFVDQDFNIIDDIEGLFFDQLFEVIDRRLDEKIKVEFSLN